jgi:uncharacterized membrane-anchored protein
MARKALRYVLFFALLALAWSLVAAAQEPPPSQQSQPKIDWQVGPTTARLGNIATLKIPAGYQFTGVEGTRRVLDITHNPASGKELGVVVPQGDNESWLMFFEFEDTGYVKDDEKDKLDADALLKSIKDGTEEANVERQKRGWKPFHVTGWQHTPFYDPITHNLTWAIIGRGDDPASKSSVNHSIRLLGRRGTMDVDLVVSPDEYAASTSEFNSIISGFSYAQGSRYSDFVKGDKVAEYGLAALIAGGAGAVLLKTGLLAKFWKLIVVGIAALVGFIKKLFSSIFGSKETKLEDPNSNAAAQGQ